VACLIGLNLLNFGAEADLGALSGSIVRAEDVGFDLLMTSDHVVITDDVQAAYPAPFREPFTLLAWASGRTGMSLGTTVAVLPYRHPELVASMVDTIEHLSGRPFTLGVGVGWAEQEFERLEVPFAARGDIFDRDLSILVAHRAGTPNEPDLSGVRSGHFRSAIWLGGNGRRARRRAARLGLAWHPLGVTPAALMAGVEELSASGGGAPLAPRIKLRPGPQDDKPGRRLGSGSWEQITADLELTLSLGATHIVLDPDVPETRAGADPWPALERAVRIIRDVRVPD